MHVMETSQIHESDVLIIGGGGAAVRAAIEAARGGVSVTLADKGCFERSGTSPLSLHGFSTVLHCEDSEEKLLSDIAQTGCGINDLDLVRKAVLESRFEPKRLEEMGVRFVHNTDGSYYFYRGAGQSVPHNLVFDEAGNGINFVAVLAKEAWKRNVRLVDGVMTTELLVDNGRVVGAIGIDAGRQIHTFSAAAAVLAAGGANRIYPNVVPRISHPMYRTTGDGYVLALQAGLRLVDMEFANFRDSPPAASFGGIYLNAKDERFMSRYDPVNKEKAPRGKIVEAIFREMQAGNGPVYIAISQESERIVEFLADEYKAYVRACKEGKRPPVTITFQRLLGGARINPDSSSEINGLYIAGENAGGFHGADRLQGAAFLETQVFGCLAGIEAAAFARRTTRKHIPKGLIDSSCDKIYKTWECSEGQRASEIVQRIHKLTWNHASIVREIGGLKKALNEVEELRTKLKRAVGEDSFEVLEVQNLALTAELVLRAALAREETRGTHRRTDFPEPKEEWAHYHVSLGIGADGFIQTSRVPVRR
jgi:succinate dehydrogenase/fumarate reductase flavoprotein subunit